MRRRAVLTKKIRKYTCRSILFIVILAMLSGCSNTPFSAVNDYSIEENQNENSTTYPYVIHLKSSTWYLAKDDIALLGEDQFYDGLNNIIRDMEADFSDARAALAGYIPEEIEPVDILTDFCGKAGISEIAGAYYNERSCFIKVFSGWDMVKEALLHEYVHYLTMHCMDRPPTEEFFAEGIVEYISKITCKNRMLRSVNMGFSKEEALFYKEHGAWDETEECIDPKLFYFGTAGVISHGGIVGMEYTTVSNTKTIRTAQFQQYPTAKYVSHIEAGCIMAYLVDTYSKDLIFKNLNIKSDELESVIGESFAEIYEHWTEWNAKQCEELGLQ